MPNNLKIFLAIGCIITFLLLCIMLKRKKILFKHYILWSLIDGILAVSIFNLELLKNVANFIGIEEISNMIFLFGFIVIIAICIHLTTIVAEQKNKITVLIQELGIIKNQIGGNDDAKDKRSREK